MELVYTPASGGEPERHLIHTFEDGGGVTLGMYNTDKVKQCVLELSINGSSRGRTSLCQLEHAGCMHTN